MKQVLINVLIGLVFLGTISCQSSPKTYEEHMERLRKTVPTSALNYESVWKTYYGDYTGDGKDELIAFVCEHYGQSEGIYHLYYSTSKKVFVYDTLTLDKSFEAQIIEDGSGSLLYFYYLSDKPSTFEYDDNADLKICLYKCTKKGLSKINPPDEERLFGYDRKYNCFFSYSLPIEASIPYFYYVEDGEFREFGGLEVTEDNFKKIRSLMYNISQNDLVPLSFNEWLDVLNQLYVGKITNMIYRDMGEIKLLELNLDATSTGEGFECFRSFYDNSGEFMFEGVYYGNAKLANTPQIAVYPDID